MYGHRGKDEERVDRFLRFVEFVGFDMKITRFEDIKAWQETRKLVNLVYGAINDSEIFTRDFRLSGQILGSKVITERLLLFFANEI